MFIRNSRTIHKYLVIFFFIFIIKNENMNAGDLVAFRSAGAYGAVMSSEYNTRPLIPEVMVNGSKFAVIRSRPSFDEIINRDTIPEWL